MNAEDKARARAKEIREAILALQRHTQELLEQLLAIEGAPVLSESTIEELTTDDGQVIFIFPATRFVVMEQDRNQD